MRLTLAVLGCAFLAGSCFGAGMSVPLRVTEPGAGGRQGTVTGFSCASFWGGRRVMAASAVRRASPPCSENCRSRAGARES